MTETQTSFTDDQLFITLVTDLTTQAWVALGKIKHPISDKIERNIPAAGIIIDMLDMLNRKTTGNRTELEDRLLLDSLQQLKLNYITEASKPAEPEAEATEGEVAEEEKATPTADQEKPAAKRTRKRTGAVKEAKPTGRKKTPAAGAKQKKSSGTKNDQSAKSPAPDENDA
ncbi:MAG: DUF1844 domain-containing protein [Candidatus Neomarinimicrobiota bacterium]